MVPSASRCGIPVDYTFSKSFLSLLDRDVTVYDATGAVVYAVQDSSHCRHSSRRTVTLLDAFGIPLISVVHISNGSWEGFVGGRLDPRGLIFAMRRIPLSPFDVEMDVHLAFESFRLKGNPMQRSCTIYRGNSVVAKSSLLYKLGKVVYSTRKFLLTVYPGIDHAMANILLAIFVWGSG